VATTRTQPMVGARRPRRGRLPALGMGQERVVYGSAGLVVTLVLWETVVRLGLIRGSLLSSPSRIVDTAIREFGTGTIWPHISTSLLEWVLGFVAALAVGIPLGLLIGSFRRVDYLLDPWISALYATPTVALVPLIILVFGVGLESKVVVVVLEAIFMVIVSTTRGVQATDARHLEIARSFRASRWLEFTSVVLPSTVPFILTGIRLGASRALVGVVVAEFLAANVGIGFYISFAGTTLNTSQVMLGIILLGLFGLAMGELIRRIELRFDVWRPAIH
jgi:ABC-type nitrate/sulfonate/bicarbonate transport system permease component